MVRKKQFEAKHTELKTATRNLKNIPKQSKKLAIKFFQKCPWIKHAPKTNAEHISLVSKNNKDILRFLNNDEFALQKLNEYT